MALWNPTGRMAPREASCLDREPGGVLPERIVRFSSNPFQAPVAPSVPAHFRRAHLVAPRVLPSPVAESLFSVWGAKGAALVLPPPLPLTPTRPNPSKIRFPSSNQAKSA